MPATSSPYRDTAGPAFVPGRSSTTEPSRMTGRAQVPGAYGTPPTRSGGGPGGPGGPRYTGTPRRGPKPRWGRIALVAALALLLLGGLGAGAFALYAKSLNDDLKRTDPFSTITGGRPAKPVSGSLNILLVGSDSRDPDAPLDKASKWRADTIIVMHIPASHDKAYVVSVPRDLYVPIPESAGADCGGDRGKINAAFARGGLPLAVRTVECFTDVRMDHVIAIDFGGFKEVTDALGGVDLNIERDITSIHPPNRKFKKGVQHLNGAEALDYIRQRKQFPDGDFARMRHQQEFLKALLDKAASSGTLTNPVKLKAFLDATTKAMTVDKEFSLVDMAIEFRNLRGESLQFLVNPHKGSQDINGESVVVSDRENALAMYQAMAADKMADWVKANASPPPGQGG
ncbi:MAG TPA: LCP family protein [Pilimelia sp.]|nr:LCP family protein [Pilimelia sp.]